MIYKEMTKRIREVCKKLLDNKTADVIIAYRGGGIAGLLTPYFARMPDEVGNIEWGDRCYQNLAAYLPGLDIKAAILAKPCDARAIAQYIKEHQVKRENVFIIGVDCIGMVDENGNPRPGCGDCEVRSPRIFDEYIKDERVFALKEKKDSAECDDLAGDFTKFQKEIEKCILCCACRQACYGCYCKSCFIEREMPSFLPADVDSGTKMTFHLGRAMHLAGRCVECGACEASCQSGVNVRYLIKGVTDFIKEINEGGEPLA